MGRRGRGRGRDLVLVLSGMGVRDAGRFGV